MVVQMWYLAAILYPYWCYAVEPRGRAGGCKGNCALSSTQSVSIMRKYILTKQNKSINSYSYSRNEPYDSCTLQLPIYRTRSALSESNNLYLQSLMVKTNILDRPGPVFSSRWSLSAGSDGTSSESSFQCLLLLSDNTEWLFGSQPRVFNTSCLPRGHQIQTNPSCLSRHVIGGSHPCLSDIFY